MKIAIVYASETGNTAQIAQAIREGCQGHEIVAFGPLPRDVGEAELIFVGSWTDKGTCAPAVKEFLQGLHGKRVALFGTAGFGLAAVLGRVWREQTGRTLELSAVHVGLEPSVFRAKAPGLVMASAGPDILDAHSVDERAPLDGLPDYALLLAGAMEAL